MIWLWIPFRYEFENEIEDFTDIHECKQTCCLKEMKIHTYDIPTLLLQNTNCTGHNKRAHKHNKGSWKWSAHYIPYVFWSHMIYEEQTYIQSKLENTCGLLHFLKCKEKSLFIFVFFSFSGPYFHPCCVLLHLFLHGLPFSIFGSN